MSERASSDAERPVPRCDRPAEAKPACPVCGGRLIEQRAKLICSRCRTVCETCCEGGQGCWNASPSADFAITPKKVVEMPVAALRDVLGRLDVGDPRYATDVVDRVLAEGTDARRERRSFSAGFRFTRIALAARRRAAFGRTVACEGRADVVARLKVLAELLTYRTDVPQEGRFRNVAGNVEMRLSTFPTLFGEKAVVRMFAGSGQFLGLADLGLPAGVQNLLSHRLDDTAGAIVLAGPAGSGKTTTIYACLAT